MVLDGSEVFVSEVFDGLRVVCVYQRERKRGLL